MQQAGRAFARAAWSFVPRIARAAKRAPRDRPARARRRDPAAVTRRRAGADGDDDHASLVCAGFEYVAATSDVYRDRRLLFLARRRADRRAHHRATPARLVGAPHRRCRGDIAQWRVIGRRRRIRRIPAKAGTEYESLTSGISLWIPAFAGMSGIISGRQAAPKNQGRASTPPVSGCGAPVVAGNVIGRPRRLRTAR
jgi:hypothetical protein